MGFFNRSGSGRTVEEAQQLRSLVKRGSAEEFLATYRSSDATDPELGQDLLAGALAQRTPALRPVIAGRLLDDGADPRWIFRGGSSTLHVLLGQSKHDVEAEAPLLERLLVGGADVNLRVGRYGTPLEVLVEKFKYSDADLAPFYDVLLARPDLDLRQVSNFDRPVLETIRACGDKRADLLARAERYLEEH